MLCLRRHSGLSEGGYAAQGHSVPARDQTLNVPGIDSTMVELCAKAAMVYQAEAGVMVFKMAGTKCGQAVRTSGLPVGPSTSDTRSVRWRWRSWPLLFVSFFLLRLCQRRLAGGGPF